MIDKVYNTHLVRLWLDNNRNNYVACGEIKVREYKTDAELIKWLKQRYYGGDADKIRLDKNLLYMDAIRETIKENMQAINA